MEQPQYKPIDDDYDDYDEYEESPSWTCDYCGIEIGLLEVEANDHHCNSCSTKRF